MKARILLMFVLAMLLLSGCSQEVSQKSNTNQNKQPQEINQTSNSSDADNYQSTSGEFIVEGLERIRYKIRDLQDTRIKSIELSLPEQSGIGFADIYNEQILFSIGYSENQAHNIALILFNIDSGISKELYHGKGFTNDWDSKSVVLSNGDLAFQTQEKVLIFDKDNLNIKKEISLPSDGYSYSISNDGTKITYGKNHNLYISEIDQISKPKLLVKGQVLKGPDGEYCGGVVSPNWSADDSKLSYILFTYEESEGFGIINSDGSGNVELKPRGFIPDYAYFYRNSEKLLCAQVTFEKPKVFSYDIRENNLEEINIEEEWRNFIPHPNEDKIVFSTRRDITTGQLFLYNLESKQVEPISPILDIPLYIKWDNTGKKIVAHLNRNKIAVVEVSD